MFSVILEIWGDGVSQLCVKLGYGGVSVAHNRDVYTAFLTPAIQIYLFPSISCNISTSIQYWEM